MNTTACKRLLSLGCVPSHRRRCVAGLDPPYDFDGWTDLLESLIELVAADGVVAVESDREIDAGPRWNVDSHRRTAGTVVMLLRPESDPA